MDFSGSEIYEDADSLEGGEKSGCLGRLLRFLLISICVITVTVVFCGWLLTTDLGRLWLIGRINRAIAPAELTVKSWDVPLLGAASLKDVEYYAPHQGTRFNADQVTLTKGVFALVPIGKLALGEIIINAPVVTFDPASVVEIEKRERPGSEVAVQDGEAKSFFLPVADIGGKLKIRDGSLIVRDAGQTIFHGSQFEGGLTVDSLWRPFGFALKGHCAGGELSLNADLRSIMALLNGDAVDYNDKLAFQLAQVDLAALKPLFTLAEVPLVPASGIAEGALTLERAGKGFAFNAEGGVLVDDLRLIGTDGKISPAGSVALLVDAALQDGLYDIRKFEFSSPWGRARANGILRQVDAGRRFVGAVDAELTLDAPAFVRDFRPLLHIDKEFDLTGGKINGTLNLKEAGDGVDLKLSLKADNVAMRYQGTHIVMERAPALDLKAHISDKLFPDIEELRLRGSFVDIYGKGNLRQAALKGYLDLTQFSKEMRGLFKSGSVIAGATHFNLLTTPVGADTNVDLMVKVSRINMSTPTTGHTAVKDGSFAFNGVLAGTAGAVGFADLTFRDVTYDMRLEKSRVNGEIKRFAPVQKDARIPVLRGFSLSAELLMTDLVSACGAFVSHERFTQFAGAKGKMLFNAAAESANNVARIRVNGAGREIEYKVAGKTVVEPDIRLNGGLTFSASENSFVLSEVKIESDSVNLNIPDWSLQLPGQGGALSFAGRIEAQMDAALLSPLFAADDDSGYDQIRGNLVAGIDASGQAGATELEIRALLSDYYMLKDGDIVFFEKQAGLDAQLTLRNSGNDLAVNTFKLNSTLADLVFNGVIKDCQKSRSADLKGDLNLKFDAVEKLLRVRGIDEWRMSGGKSTPFVLKGPLTEEFLRTGSFDGGAYLTSLSGLGLNAGASAINLSFNRGSLVCQWNPELNGGRLRFNPICDFTARGCALTFPVGQQILENVKITQEMVDKILVHCNPLFYGSRIIGGTVSAKNNTFVSGAEPGHADLVIDATCSLDNFEMALSPSMMQLLSMIHVKDKVYKVKQLPMRVTVRDERVYLDQLTMNFSGQPVVFSGSVGFNSTIKYLIEIPLGESIARRTGLKLPGNLVVKVPVSGTVDNPKLDTGALRKALGGFISNALGDDAVKSVTDFLNQLKNNLK